MAEFYVPWLGKSFQGRLVFKQWSDGALRRFWNHNHDWSIRYVRPDISATDSIWVAACMEPGCYQCATVKCSVFGGQVPVNVASEMFRQKGWYEDEETGEMYCQLHTPLKEGE